MEESKCQPQQYSLNLVPKCITLATNLEPNTTSSLKRSSSSGYGGSQRGSSNCINEPQLRENGVAILEQNTNCVKSIRITATEKSRKRTSRISSSYFSGSSAAGTLSTIPEGRVDISVPKPIWPKLDLKGNKQCDCLDETSQLYTNSDIKQYNHVNCINEEQSVKEILTELLNGINATMERNEPTAEEMLRIVNEKILLSMEALKRCTEEEMRKLCLNLSNSRNVLAIVRALGPSSGNSSENSSGNSSSPEWTNGREQAGSCEVEEIYQIPSASSSSGFSDSFKQFDINQLPTFVHENLCNVPNGVRNAMIYGTLYRGNHKFPVDKCGDKEKCSVQRKKGLLQACGDDKPSVWEQYYGQNVLANSIKEACASNSVNIPIYVSFHF